MNNILLNIIDRELKAWNDELSIYFKFMDRAALTDEQYAAVLFKRGACEAIVRELEDLRSEIMDFKNKYQQFAIYTEEKETNGEKWTRFYTLLYLVVKGEEGIGLQRKYVNVKINPLIDTKPFKKGGVFILEAGKYKLPEIYEIKTNPDTGKTEYPYMYIHEVASYMPLDVINNERKKKNA